MGRWPFGVPDRCARRLDIRDASAEELYPDWEEAADTAVAILRTEAGRDPAADKA